MIPICRKVHPAWGAATLLTDAELLGQEEGAVQVGGLSVDRSDDSVPSVNGTPPPVLTELPLPS